MEFNAGLYGTAKICGAVVDCWINLAFPYRPPADDVVGIDLVFATSAFVNETEDTGAADVAGRTDRPTLP